MAGASKAGVRRRVCAACLHQRRSPSQAHKTRQDACLRLPSTRQTDQGLCNSEGSRVRAATWRTRHNPSTVGLPAPPLTAPCVCALLAAPPPARIPYRRPRAVHPYRCPARTQRPACVRVEAAMGRRHRRRRWGEGACEVGVPPSRRSRPTSHAAAHPLATSPACHPGYASRLVRHELRLKYLPVTPP